MNPPDLVLERFGRAISSLTWRRVVGGFSGAAVWRGEDVDCRPHFALKGWPIGYPPERLLQNHKWISNAAEQLPFVPTIVSTPDGMTIVHGAGQLWDAMQWMPGESRLPATIAEVEAASAAIANLHAAWRGTARAPCPGVHNRLQVLLAWLAAPPSFSCDKHFTPRLKLVLQRAAGALAALAPRVVDELVTWETKPLPLQPCVRDLRGEHILFTGSSVSGIVDFGAMALDSPAVDLARLLGDLTGGNVEGFAAGLRCYRQSGGVLDAEDEFVQLLDRSGTLGSVATWIRRLELGERGQSTLAAAEARLQVLVDRIERCKPI